MLRSVKVSSGVFAMRRVLQRFAVLLIGASFASFSFGVCSDHSHQTSLAGYALSPDATRVAAIADDGTLFWWDVASGNRTELMECVTTQAIEHPILFNPDSKRLAVVVNEAVYVFDVAAGSIVARLTSVKIKEIYDITFSADGRRLAAGNADGAVVWDVANQSELLAVLEKHNHRAFALNHDGTSLAFAGSDGIEIWTVALPMVEPRIRLAKDRSAEWLLFVDGTQELVALEATPLPPEPKQKILQFKREVVLWNYVTGQKLKTFERDPGELRFPLAIGNRNSLFAVDYHDHLFVWNMDSGKLTATWETPSGHLSADGKFLLRETGQPGRLDLWEIGSPDQQARALVYRSSLCGEPLSGAAKLKFQPTFIADGESEEDAPFGSFNVLGYVAQDCTTVGFSRSTFNSPERAKREFDGRAAQAAEILETGPPKGLWAETFSGSRMVVRFAGRHSGPQRYVVMWVRGSSFSEISSLSLADVLAFEKQMLTGH
jgi:WD40 repeat protein